MKYGLDYLLSLIILIVIGYIETTFVFKDLNINSIKINVNILKVGEFNVEKVIGIDLGVQLQSVPF